MIPAIDHAARTTLDEIPGSHAVPLEHRGDRALSVDRVYTGAAVSKKRYCNVRVAAPGISRSSDTFGGRFI